MCEWVCNECAKGVHSPVRFFQGETEGDTEGLRMGSKVKAGCGGSKVMRSRSEVTGSQGSLRVVRSWGQRSHGGRESSPLGVNVRGHRGHKVRGQRLLWVKGSEVNRGHGS